ncbi:MAG TPA: hypothetical protein VGR51_04115, partial [Thermoplasmata archaeon]|nr:hypothetical protein [Thermoplasmata archaeon]
MRTSPGGTDALKNALVDLKRYSFSGYVKTVFGSAIGCVVVMEGNPELALYDSDGKLSEGKVALKSVWQDSYSDRCSIEIHAKVDVAQIRERYPRAVLERVKKSVKVTPKTVAPKLAQGSAGREDARVAAWRESGYDVSSLEPSLRLGGAEAEKALEEFEAAAAKMAPLRREAAAMDEPGLLGEIAALRQKARDPRNVERVGAGLAHLREEIERLRNAEETAKASSDRESQLQDRARRVFEMIVKHRAAEGKPVADISEVQVARAIEGKPTTRDERTNLIRQYTFDTFVVGPSNRFAHAASV